MTSHQTHRGRVALLTAILLAATAGMVGADAASAADEVPADPSFGGTFYLADGNTLVSCGHDRTVKFWDVEAALPSETYTRGHDWFTPWMAFSSDASLLATSSMAGEVRVWDVATRRLKMELPPASVEPTILKSRRMAFSPDSTKLAVATSMTASPLALCSKG